MEEELAMEKRRTFAYNVFKGGAGGETELGYKLLVSKLSGFAKFDLDTKINRFQFFHMIEEMVTDVEM